MGKIQRLDKSLIKKIAAGEVIERPASVVKELVENAIDAKSDSIVIELENGGKKLIKIIDTGEGIEKQDLNLVLDRHTTSKIKTEKDIDNITTLGFRGEALYSISSISKFKLTSRAQNAKIAYELTNFPEFKISPTSRQIGTTIEVVDLFYNLPARLKFLKSANTELKHILNIVEAYAISFPNIHFKLIHNDKVILDLPKTQHQHVRVAQILNIDHNDIITLSSTHSNINTTILLPNQSIQLSNKGFFKVFVNNRYVNEHGVKRAVKQGLHSLIPPETKVSAIVFININPSLIDVNIHPRKTEVRFENPFRIYYLIEKFVEQNTSKIAKNVLNNSRTMDKSAYFDTKYNNAVNRLRPQQSHLQSPLQSQPPLNKISDSHAPFLGASNTSSFTKTQQAQQNQQFANNQNSNTNTINITDTTVKTLYANSPVTEVMQVFNKYVLAQIGSDLWVIDQHAAYERIRYEKFINTKHNPQKLLTPIKLSPTKSQILLLKDMKKDLEELGFNLTIKKDHILINSIPNTIKQNQVTSLFYKALSNAQTHEHAFMEFKNIEHNRKSLIAATFACHTAIRTGDKLTKQEMLKLIDDLLACKVPTSCPHGRPTIHILKLTDIDKWFLRTY